MKPPICRRMSLPPVLAKKEGERIQVPEGGELVCYRNQEDQHLFLKIEYSRETMIKLSSSVFCYARPTGLKEVSDELPELLGLPHSIPLTDSPPNFECLPEPLAHVSGCNSHFSMNHPPPLLSPLRGPVTEADEAMRTLSSHRELQKRLQNMSMRGELSPSGCLVDSCDTPAIRQIRNPQFT
ncbi:SH2 domain-containing protein [Caenorhabditis elegans]|uniref:SH2 domain-containing protein n=1 Tax=Caenorhabditis elegans TaxID=6239 RepID=Q22497_CAEEL|nr:SH2 domain-containing protein [Caenorhabditis elegans]CAA93094.1 SH2 domain-containing protein [Caenorhabditis elegans]|eukprot:NP_501851.1 Uncharacterized protein CELE_T14G10.8 [Caenorhabditis elegans]